jgi:hypothetical protein
MKSLHKLFFILLLTGSCAYAQTGTTVFVTGEAKEVKKEKTPFFGEAAAFSTFSISIPIRGNDSDSGDDEDRSWFLPDGITAHGGFGVHATETFALSANAGIDGIISEKLVAAPVYASLLINPSVSDGASLYFQGGVGYAFALGRGDLSGVYQKYRIGFTNDEDKGVFIEVNSYGFGVYNNTNIYSINLGVSFFNF